MRIRHSHRQGAVVIAVVLALLAATGCQKAGETKPAATTQESKTYTCPMHPEVVQDKPGTCPICHMDLVVVETKPSAPKKEAKTYTCPMHPEIVQNKPGTCPICHMDLVVVETGPSTPSKSDSQEHASIVVDATKRQLLGMKTVEVVRAPLSVSVRTVGRVTYDERLVHHVHTRFTAFVEHVHADFTGKAVTKGEALAALYSPELFATQKEYLLALKAAKSLSGSSNPGVSDGGRDLLEAARQRLLLWEISPADIEKIEKTGEPQRLVDVYAPISGVIVGRTAFHGMKVMPTDILFDIVDLSRVWVLADVYEYELPKVRIGDTAEVTLSYWPGKKWPASVTYIYPSVDEKTRTVRVRLELLNPRGELKPEMYADVVMRGPARNVLQLPEDAVLDSGRRKIVFTVKDEGEIEPREVVTGDRSEGHVEILSGLAAGEKVAVRANFLLDSESRLKAALLSMRESDKDAVPTPPQGHEKH